MIYAWVFRETCIVQSVRRYDLDRESNSCTMPMSISLLSKEWNYIINIQNKRKKDTSQTSALLL